MDLSWDVTVRCAWGKRRHEEYPRCVYGAELDLPTLVWTRGRDFPLARLESRLKYPRCGSRRVRLAFSVSPNNKVMRYRPLPANKGASLHVAPDTPHRKLPCRRRSDG